ncbi:MAG: thioredoxin family protein [Acidobacteriota bacterium]|nr:thioredoxin family protein [Acidobacteriota bacterium]
MLRMPVLLVLLALSAGATTACAAEDFAPLEAWRKAVLAGDAAALGRIYLPDPRASFQSPQGKTSDPKDEIAFWSGLKSKGLRSIALEIAKVQAVAGAKAKQVVFTAMLVMPGRKRLYVNEAQLWASNHGAWQIAGTQRTETARLEQPLEKHSLYPADANAKQNIAAALAAAAREHKRVLVVFGADWCFDCHVLDKAFERSDVAPLLQRSFKVVHIDIGKGDRNQDLMTKYDVPMAKGIPGVAVLDARGKLLYSQRNGEFEKARALGPEDLVAFLEKWKPAP